ncbi:RNA polymerase subunit sigma-70 [Falsiroseomonas bella]|uniref:RNA polymerase subunit sigma-70 n=1 Tax=Falsiroseomonas bella TaxID=2184016 RepID=A0A317FKL4_9PROT|nr:RNA polymerase sigma factor [Falsiroseomonas bella]PWS38188.1 RNA polymerase subunit sigma-70 [Falsiroseomonas bella]
MSSDGSQPGPSDFAKALVALLPRLRRFGAGLAGSLDAADDLVQAACERALRMPERFTPGTRLDSWMFRIMQNIWIDQRRAQARRGPATGEPDAIAALVGADGRRETEATLTLERVWAAMDALPEEQRAVLVAVCVEGLSYAETAELLEIPVGTVMSRLFRARRALGAALGLASAAYTGGSD